MLQAYFAVLEWCDIWWCNETLIFSKNKSYQDKTQFSSVKEQSKPASIIHVFTIMRYDLWAWECLIWHREEEWNDNVWADGRPSKHFLSEQTFLQKCWRTNMGENSCLIRTKLYWWPKAVFNKCACNLSTGITCLTTQDFICLMIAKEKVANLPIKTDEQSPQMTNQNYHFLCFQVFMETLSKPVSQRSWKGVWVKVIAPVFWVCDCTLRCSCG